MNNRAREIAVEYRADVNDMEEQAYEQQSSNRIMGCDCAIFCSWRHLSVIRRSVNDDSRKRNEELSRLDPKPQR